jgi:NAD-dependent SIR2 family protein deacetylase
MLRATCPHCGARVKVSDLMRTTRSKPYACPECGKPSRTSLAFRTLSAAPLLVAAVLTLLLKPRFGDGAVALVWLGALVFMAGVFIFSRVLEKDS